jgi:hypothetical protein
MTAANPKFWQADGRRTKEYTDSLILQLERWREGWSWHNTFSDECCPDFSCCRPDMLTPEAERRERANREIAALRPTQ